MTPNIIECTQTDHNQMPEDKEQNVQGAEAKKGDGSLRDV